MRGHKHKRRSLRSTLCNLFYLDIGNMDPADDPECDVDSALENKMACFS
jgi:hypothetical protein